MSETRTNEPASLADLDALEARMRTTPTTERVVERVFVRLPQGRGSFDGLDVGYAFLVGGVAALAVLGFCYARWPNQTARFVARLAEGWVAPYAGFGA